MALISYAYGKLLEEGLRHATEIAILNANYMQHHQRGIFNFVYRENSRSAHELIMTVIKSKGIEITDIAKRLMDYGFHAPTVSFPVPGTMMIEPMRVKIRLN